MISLRTQIVPRNDRQMSPKYGLTDIGDESFLNAKELSTAHSNAKVIASSEMRFP
jgi:hypothetical protein